LLILIYKTKSSKFSSCSFNIFFILSFLTFLS
jgi:hypothetical protein